MKQGILIASFGTSYETTRQNTIGAIEALIRETYFDYQIVSAYTSQRILNVLRKRGISILSVEEALEQLAEQGVEVLIVLPTLVIPGEEYEKLLGILRCYQERFVSIRCGLPLLSTTQDLKEAVDLMLQCYPQEDYTCVIWMGHGTEHLGNMVYPALSYLIGATGRYDHKIATVKGIPTLEEVLACVAREQYPIIQLVPLLFVAGEHVKKDMAGDGPDSWKSKLEAKGFSVKTQPIGLGERADFRKMYLRHIEEAKVLE